jgi:hypothetical protein
LGDESTISLENVEPSKQCWALRAGLHRGECLATRAANFNGFVGKRWARTRNSIRNSISSHNFRLPPKNISNPYISNHLPPSPARTKSRFRSALPPPLLIFGWARPTVLNHRGGPFLFFCQEQES